MKTIKTLFWLIILGLLGTLIYQNKAYFMTPSALTLNLKFSTWQWTLPELQNIVYWGICFGLGLLLTGIKGLFTAFRLGREIKRKNASIDTLKQEINDLKTKLDVFVHDPYIKREMGKPMMEKKPAEALAIDTPKPPESPGAGEQKPNKE